MGDEDDTTRRRTTRDADDRLVFDKRDTRASDRGAPWFEKIARPGARSEAMPGAQHRVAWGAKTNVQVAVNGENVSGQFEQVVDARYPFPTSWNLGLYAQIAQSGVIPDSVVFKGQVVYGSGRASFTEVIDIATLAASTASAVVFRGPFPAESIFIDGIWVLTFGDAAPHTTSLVFGAWVAPQVWI